jgi:hypothetical protein
VRWMTARKELMVSLLGGILIPVCHSLQISSLFALVRLVRLKDLERYERVLSFPIFFPVWFGEFSGIRPARTFVGDSAIISIAIPVFFVYALLTYGILRLGSRVASRQKLHLT